MTSMGSDNMFLAGALGATSGDCTHLAVIVEFQEVREWRGGFREKFG